MTVISSRIRKPTDAAAPRPAKDAGGGGPNRTNAKAAVINTAANPAASETAPAASTSAPARPAVAAVDTQSGLVALLRLEAEVRAAASERDLAYLIANETRKLVRSRQVFVLAGRPGAMQVTAVSSLAAVDRTAPLVGWIEAMVNAALATGEAADAVTLDPQSGDDGGTGSAYPFRALIALPLRHRSGTMLGAVVVARETAWIEQDLVVGKRLAGAYAHAWSALAAPRLARPWQRWSKRHAAATAAV
ncbi:MAG: hypothetical protein ABL908_16505, partial [Hyphomicrobium sp.]